ncbi:MAG TPA: type II toxin-antitoxin system VapC family toxin [Bryobacteraceae bacterium]|jgi:predicted nucleic acid-binding protein|nr:type II toxin-antitoxin system VapC family toxin [Bryobacteraceae bacterium]
MAALIDTNVLLRLLQPQHSQYSIAATALAELRRQRADLCVAPQNLVEFWVVATRPVPLNGLGMSPLMVTGEVRRLRGLFRLLEGKPGVADAWERLAAKHLISGKLAHDAHLVAVMQVYSVTDILTFNGTDFRRFPGINVLDPAQF